MKKILLLLYILSISFPNFAQNSKITWGEEKQPAKRGTVYSIVGEREGGIFVIKKDKKDRRYLDRFNLDDLSFDFSKDIELSKSKNSRKKSDKLEYKEILLMKKNIIVFATNYDKKVKQLKLFARKYDFDGRPDGRWNNISKIEGKKKKNKGSFAVAISEDKEFFVVEESYPPTKDVNGEEYEFSVFDSDLIKVYEKEDITLLKEEGAKLKSHKVGKDNRVYFISVHSNSDKLYSFDVNTDAKDLKEFNITFENKDIIESAFSFDAEGNILIVGFYTERGKKYNYGLSGTFYIKLNAKTFEPIVSKTNEFDKEFLTNFMSERRAAKGKSGIPLTFDMSHFVIKPDGSVIVMAESRFSVQHCQSSNTGGPISVGVQYCYWIHHFNEIIVLNIDSDGTTKYSHVIKKRGSSRDYDNGLLSFGIRAKEDKIMVLYNDHYKNLKEGNKKVRDLPSFKKRVLVMQTISEEGESEIEIIAKHSDEKLEILPRNAVKTDGGVILFGYYKKTIRIGKIMLD